MRDGTDITGVCVALDGGFDEGVELFAFGVVEVEDEAAGVSNAAGRARACTPVISFARLQYEL